MEKKNSPPCDDTTVSLAASTTNEVAAALLEILRHVALPRVTPSPELSNEALAAVENFRAISAALNVVPFISTRGNGKGNGNGSDGNATPA